MSMSKGQLTMSMSKGQLQLLEVMVHAAIQENPDLYNETLRSIGAPSCATNIPREGEGSISAWIEELIENSFEPDVISRAIRVVWHASLQLNIEDVRLSAIAAQAQLDGVSSFDIAKAINDECIEPIALLDILDYCLAEAIECIGFGYAAYVEEHTDEHQGLMMMAVLDAWVTKKGWC